jgi:hypothetical protein
MTAAFLIIILTMISAAKLLIIQIATFMSIQAKISAVTTIALIIYLSNHLTFPLVILIMLTTYT